MEIISNNAFRVLGLPVNSSEKQIVSQYDELLALNKIGKVPAFSNDFEWISKPDRSEESIRKAFHVLQTPERKIEHMIFWFWEHDEIDKMAISSLSEGKISQAINIWEQAVDRKGKNPIYYLKNLASLSFACLAVNIEKNIVDTIAGLKKCIDFWGDLLGMPQFWKELERQSLISHLSLNERDDIKVDILRHIHSAIHPFIEIESDAGTEIKKKYLNCLASSKFPDSARLHIIALYLSPISSEIMNACEKAKEVRSTAPKDALVAAEKLIEITQKPLGIIKSLLSEEEESIISLHDEVIKEVSQCCICYSNEADNLNNVKPILLRAKEVAMGSSAIDRVENDLAKVDEIIEKRKEYVVIDKIYKKLENSHLRLQEKSWFDQHYKVGIDVAMGLKANLDEVAQKFGYPSNEYETVVKHCVNFIRYCSIEAANNSSQYIKAEELIDIAINLICFKYTDGRTYVVDSELDMKLREDKIILKNNNTNDPIGALSRIGIRTLKRNKLCPCGSGKKYKDCCTS